MPFDPRTPSLANVLGSVLDRFAARMHVAIPARVERYDAATQRVDAQPLVKDRALGEDESTVVERLPVVTGVPLCFPSAGPYGITFPIAVGDTVLLVFADRSLDVWLSQGGEVDPLETRRHHMSDAVAIPGVRPFSAPIAPAPSTTHVVVGKLDEATDAVALAAQVAAQLNALKSAIETAPVVAGDGGASFKAALIASLSSWPASVGSNTVKVST